MLSSQIEGTQSSLSDLLLFELEEAPGVPLDDVVEVSNHVAALEHGVARLGGGFPLSNRLLREVHGTLLSRGRGSDKQPGEFRRSQNWIGGTRPGDAHFVPPPAADVEDCIAALERFIHDRSAPYPALSRLPGLCSTEFLVLRPRPPAGPAFTYCFARSHSFRQGLEGLATGTSKSHQRAQVTSLLALPAVRPSPGIAQAFERQAGQLLERSLECRREGRTLAALRDALLPKLVSGERRVRDAERFIARDQRLQYS